MYGYIEGNIRNIENGIFTVLVEGTGLGLDILISPSVAQWYLENQKVILWIHHHKTEVSEVLFGFVSTNERSLFRYLNKVNGVGWKTALALLEIGEEKLINAIECEDDTLLSSVVGIGKKTAQKIIVDLKGSIDFSKKPTANTENITSNIVLINSLVGMGYEKSKVESIVAEIPKNGSLSDRTVQAIRALSQ